jgi:O-antigen/teichoic acid export membrane protein
LPATEAPTQTVAPAPPAPRRESGARSSAIIAAASLAATVANYAFLVAAGRLLGADAYGALAALTGLLTLVLLPTGAVQLAVAREVSRRLAEGDENGAGAFARAMLRLALIVTAPVVVVGLVLAVPLRSLLQIDPLGPVLLAALGLLAALVLPVALGILQGHQRFHAVAGLYVLPFALRLALLAVVAGAGLLLGGAVLAVVGGAVVGALVALVLLREPLRRGAYLARPALGAFLRYLVPVVVGLLAVAVLTNVDLVIAKARFSPAAAGDYAVASAFARVAFFLPATILAVLFPRTAARQARGEDTADILGRTLLVTAAFGALLTVLYAAAGSGLLHTSFGSEFAEGGDLLVPLTLCMVLYALVNALVGFHLSRAETRYAWIVAGAVVVQIPLLALLPLSLRDFVWTNAVVALVLLAAHELYVGSSIPALRAGLRHFRQELPLKRRAVVESGLVLATAAVLAAVLTWPLVTELGVGFIGAEGDDASGSISWLWRLQHEGGYHLFGTVHHTLTGAPFGWDESNGLNLNWFLPYYPAYLATKVVGEVAAYNLVVLSGFALSAAAMYLLTRFLGCNPPVAAWAGLVFAMFPWHVERAVHPSLLHLEVLVLFTLALVAAAERPTVLRFGLVGATTLACWLTSGYFGVMASIGAVVFATFAWPVLGRREHGLRVLFGTAAPALAATVLVVLAGTASGIGNGAGLGRDVHDLWVYGLRPDELVVPTGRSIVFDHWTRPFHDGRSHQSNGAEVSNYVGLVTLLLAIGWLVVAWRRRRTLGRRVRTATAGLTGLAVAALAFSAPSPISVFGHRWDWTPARVLWEFVPAIRVPSRWIVLLMTALVPLAALGLQAGWTALSRRTHYRSRVPVAAVGLVTVALVASALELAIHRESGIFSTVPVPPQYEVVKQTPPGIVAEYPLERSDIDLLWQREHGRPLLSGAAGSTYPDEVRRSLVDPRQPGSAARLALLGVTSVILRDEPRTPGSGYALVRRFTNGSSLWRVSASAAPALPSLPDPDFLGPGRHPDGFLGQPLTGKTGAIDIWAPEPAIVELRFDARSTSSKSWTLTLGDGRSEVSAPVAGMTPVSTRVLVPRGFSRLQLRVDPDPDAGEFPLELSAPWARPSAGPVQLRAPSAS